MSLSSSICHQNVTTCFCLFTDSNTRLYSGNNRSTFCHSVIIPNVLNQVPFHILSNWMSRFIQKYIRIQKYKGLWMAFHVVFNITRMSTKQQTLNAPSMSKCARHTESIIWGVKHWETCLWMLKEAQTIVARSSTDCSCPLLEMPVRSGRLFVHFCRSSLNQLLPLRSAICCLYSNSVLFL